MEPVKEIREFQKCKMSGDLGSFSHDQNIFVAQFNFPADYDTEVDHVLQADDDRMFRWAHEATGQSMNDISGKHCEGMGTGTFPYWFPKNQNEKGLALVRDMFAACSTKGETYDDYTGFRIRASKNVSNGYTICTVELIKLVSDRKTYTGMNGPLLEMGGDMKGVLIEMAGGVKTLYR